MQSHINYKKKIFEREVEYYKKLQKNDFELSFVIYGDSSDLLFKKKLKNIKIIPIFQKIKKIF